MRQVFASDVCHTLFDCSTLHQFVAFVLARQPGYRLRRWVSGQIERNRFPLGLLTAASYKLLQWDAGKQLTVACLRGIPKSVLYQLGAQFVQEALLPSPLLHMSRIQAAIQAGQTVLLVSASIDPVIHPLAAALGCTAICSTLAYSADGRATGRFAADLTGRKAAALQALLTPADELTVMTDNFTDADLLQLARYRLIVLRKPAHRANWHQFDATAEFLTTV